MEEIAAHAGLTERTFFRYFSDKREVLFSGSKELEKALVDAVANAPKNAAPLDVVGDAFEKAGVVLQFLREFSYVRARYALVVEHAELRERELIKLASLAAVVTKSLHTRGVSEPFASMAAEAGSAAFKVGFQRWVTGHKPQDVATHIRAALSAPKDVAAEASVSPPPAKTAKRSAATRARST